MGVGFSGGRDTRIKIAVMWRAFYEIFEIVSKELKFIRIIIISFEIVLIELMCYSLTNPREKALKRIKL